MSRRSRTSTWTFVCIGQTNDSSYHTSIERSQWPIKQWRRGSGKKTAQHQAPSCKSLYLLSGITRQLQEQLFSIQTLRNKLQIENKSLIHCNALRHIQDKCFAELLPLHFACLPWFAQKFICWNVCFELLTFITNRFFCLLHSLSWWVPPTNCLVYAIPVGPKRVQYHPLNLLKQCQLMELLMENRLLIIAQKVALPIKLQQDR